MKAHPRHYGLPANAQHANLDKLIKERLIDSTAATLRSHGLVRSFSTAHTFLNGVFTKNSLGFALLSLLVSSSRASREFDPVSHLRNNGFPSLFSKKFAQIGEKDHATLLIPQTKWKKSYL